MTPLPVYFQTTATAENRKHNKKPYITLKQKRFLLPKCLLFTKKVNTNIQ